MIEQNRIDADNNSEIENRNEIKSSKREKKETLDLQKSKRCSKGCSMRLTVRFILSI